MSVLKKRIYALLLSLCLIMLAGCSTATEEAPSVGVDGEKKIKIGMSFDSFVIERWQRDRDVFVSTAKNLGAEVNVQNANGVLEEQRKHIEYFIEKGMDAIVIICIDSYGLSDMIVKAKQAGIRVVAYDRSIDADTDLYISFDNSKVGELMGRALTELDTPPKKVLMLGGSPSDSNVPAVENAFRAVMEENEIEIIDSMHADNWRAEEAAQFLYEHEDELEEADAIMCGNDNLAEGVINVLSEKRLAGTKYVTGQDAEVGACQRIVEETQLMTVYKPVQVLAKRAAECTIELVKNGSVTGEDVSTYNVGSYNVPYIGMEPVAVNIDNLDEVIIESGFHRKDDVYLNVFGNGKITEIPG